MILHGTYQNGFAPRDGEPLFPELWRGCVGAWNPGLGPSGLTLRDWSPFKNHGILTNVTTSDVWVTNQGRHVISIDGVDDFVRVPAAIVASGAFTVSGWFNPWALASTGNVWSRGRESDGSYIVVRINSTPRIFFSVDGVATTSTGTTALVTNRWYHWALVVSGPASSTLWLDGRIEATSASTVNYTATNNTFGATPIAGGAQFLTARIDGNALHNRILSPNEIRLLASRRGIAYEMAPRSWSADQIAAYRARYYSQVIGSGVI